jgi:hypothetical protein
MTFTASINIDGLSATGGPAIDSVGHTSGCWGAISGHSGSCLDKYESAMITGSGGVKRATALFVKATGFDTPAPGITVSLLTGAGPGSMSTQPTTGIQGTGGTPVGCTIDPTSRTCYDGDAFNYFSDQFLGLQVTTTSQTPLHGTVFVTFTVSNP